MKKSKILPAILGLATIAPSVALPQNTFADNNKSLEIKASIAETLSIELSNDEIVLDLSNMTFQYDSINVTGSTNSPYGYKIMFNADNDYNDLKHSNTQIDKLIPSITEDKTPSEFPQTAWGYSANEEEYFHQIPLESTNIFQTSTKGTQTDIFTAGAKATNMVAGSYENDLIFTIISNSPSNFSLSNITYMQDMTPDICANTATPSVNDGENTQQYRLTDIRDGKQYWVAKLADGNCWMTQNLDLEIDASKTYTPADTSISQDWTPILSTVALGTFVNPSLACNASYDQGDKYFDISINSTSSADNVVNIIPEAGNHAHVGNTYGLCVARMATVLNSWQFEAGEESICPAGWRLPGNDSIDEYYQLIEEYGELNINGAEYDPKNILGNPLYLTPNKYWLALEYSERPTYSYMYMNSNIRISSYTSTENYLTTSSNYIRCIAK